MIRLFLMTAGLIVCVVSCRNKNEPAAIVPDYAAAADSSAPFFPVYAFLRNEIDYVDSLPIGIMKYQTIGKMRDSGYIKLEEFHRLASEFLVPELNDSIFRTRFRETSFVDRTSGDATFFYKCEDNLCPVKRVDVVTTKGDVYDEVKSVYIEKTTQSAGSLILKKLYWKPKRNFQIITVNSNGERNKDELVKVVWDNRE